MARIALSETDDWQLQFDDQDVRGYDALDADGNRVGAVSDMIVNTDEKRVDAVVLDDGTEYPARDLSIGDGAVYLTSIVPDDAVSVRTYDDDYGHVVERAAPAGAGYDTYADDFRAHHRETFATAGNEYDYYEPAYRYGYESANAEDFRDRSYDVAAPDLERGYTRRFPDSPYGTVRDAVRFGYTRARRG